MTLAKRSIRDHRPGEKGTRVIGGGAEVRVVDRNKRQFVARVLQYDVIDDYGTIWKPGCFTDSLSARMPRVAWAHQWHEPIGRYLEVVEDNSSHLDLLGQLDDFDAVPRSRQCYAQMESGTIDQFSVGFTREKWTNVDDDSLRAQGAYEEMIKAALDEASPVLVGAVPGTALLAVRSARGKVDLDAVVELARRVKSGDLTVEEADEVVRLLADAEPTDPAAEVEVVEVVDLGEAQKEIDALLAEADEALTRGRR